MITKNENCGESLYKICWPRGMCWLVCVCVELCVQVCGVHQVSHTSTRKRYTNNCRSRYDCSFFSLQPLFNKARKRADDEFLTLWLFYCPPICSASCRKSGKICSTIRFVCVCCCCFFYSYAENALFWNNFCAVKKVEHFNWIKIRKKRKRRKANWDEETEHHLFVWHK